MGWTNIFKSTVKDIQLSSNAAMLSIYIRGNFTAETSLSDAEVQQLINELNGYLQGKRLNAKT